MAAAGMAADGLGAPADAANLGVTALLNELLAERTGALEECRGVSVASAALNVRSPSTSPHRSPRRLPAAKCAADIEVVSLSCGSNAERQILEEDEEEKEAARQLSELCGEMDTCFASLERWEAERASEQAALRRLLEERYGFSYEEALDCRGAADAASDIAVADDLPPLSPPLSPLALAPASRAVAAAPLAPESRPVDPTLEADEGRLAQLRAEVEALRRMEAAVASRVGAAASPLASDQDSVDLDSPTSGVANLSAWVVDVDAALRDLALTEAVGGDCGPCDLAAADPDALMRGFEVLEGQLAAAEQYTRLMQDGNDARRCRIEQDLDAMLSECERLQAS
eukprot:TRINITY_DN16672_c0_g1_i1.p1 TRINITY_DN16672_c0_g1~~TRINITY_DN16672_c0_g1_i1.p1  ORF type:complete len:370 (-),score=118.20 TRINITY_DN16672_c0_g1_i1:239-1264(-)